MFASGATKLSTATRLKTITLVHRLLVCLFSMFPPLLFTQTRFDYTITECLLNGQASAANHQISQTMMPTATPKIAPAMTSLGKCPREK